MKGLALELGPLRAVVAGLLGPSGELLNANTGFRRLLDEAGLLPAAEAPHGVRVGAFFIQPSFATFAKIAGAAGDGLLHEGLLTVGDRMGRTHSLRGRVWRVAQGVRVLAELDVEEMERTILSLQTLIETVAREQGNIGRDNLQLRQREARSTESARTDPLTGAGNRRHLDQVLENEIARARRTGSPLSAFMADLDHFKNVNDRHGHSVGDAVLVEFVKLMRRQIRGTDTLTRFGGEEFVLLMPDTALAAGIATAERIRAALAAQPIEPLPEPVTASFGVAEWRVDEDPSALIARADQALYAAKEAGRNRVEAAGAKPESANLHP